MQQLVAFAFGILIGAAGMFSVMLYVIMTKEWQQILSGQTKDMP